MATLWLAQVDPAEPTAEWAVEFNLKLQGGKELGRAGTVFAEAINAEGHVARTTAVSRPGRDTIRVSTVVLASDREEAGTKSDNILDTARRSTVRSREDGSTTAWWCGHDCVPPSVLAMRRPSD